MSRETKIQTVAALIAAVIALLRIFGITEFDNLTEDMIAAIATAIVMVGTWAYATHWKNNDFTQAASAGTAVTAKVKSGAISYDEALEIGADLEDLEPNEIDGETVEE